MRLPAHILRVYFRDGAVREIRCSSWSLDRGWLRFSYYSQDYCCAPDVVRVESRRA